MEESCLSRSISTETSITLEAMHSLEKLKTKFVLWRDQFSTLFKSSSGGTGYSIRSLIPHEEQ